MFTIGKIIALVALIYITTILLLIDYNDLSWKNNSTNYTKVLVGLFFVVFSIRLKSPKK